MNRKLIATIIITIMIMAVILTGAGGSILSALLSVLLVFVLPGYALVNLLFPENHLEMAEFIALTLGLSLATAALGGLVLNWLPWELQTHSWTVLLGSITFIACVIALLRKPASFTRSPSFIRVKLSFTFNDGLFFMLASTGVVIAFLLAYKGEVLQNNTDFTQLWILPGDEGTSSIEVGINNHEAGVTQYRLLIKVNGDVDEQIPLITLNSEETWVNSFPISEYAYMVTAELYRFYTPADLCNGDIPPDICQQNEEVYREVILKK